MSRKAIQQVMSELAGLPESDTQQVLRFLQALKARNQKAGQACIRQGHNPAVKMVDGFLVFTGELEDLETDWLQVVRQEREAELMGQAPGHGGPS